MREALASRGRWMETLKQSGDTLFLLLGAVMVLALHVVFAFL